jgi:hypothetical protein
MVTCLAFASLVTAQENQPTDLDGIMNALTSGKQVRAVFHYQKCRLMIDGEEVEKVPDAIGGMILDTYEYFSANSIGNPEAFLASSKTVMINHPSRGIVYNYGKVRIYQSGKVQIVAQYIDPKTFEVVMDESFYTAIGEGAVFYVQ